MTNHELVDGTTSAESIEFWRWLTCIVCIFLRQKPNSHSKSQIPLRNRKTLFKLKLNKKLHFSAISMISFVLYLCLCFYLSLGKLQHKQFIVLFRLIAVCQVLMAAWIMNCRHLYENIIFILCSIAGAGAVVACHPPNITMEAFHTYSIYVKCCSDITFQNKTDWTFWNTIYFHSVEWRKWRSFSLKSHLHFAFGVEICWNFCSIWNTIRWLFVYMLIELRIASWHHKHIHIIHISM